MIQTQLFTIPLSGTVSGILSVIGGQNLSLIAPVVTSCQAFLLGASTATSADFRRISYPSNSGDWVWAVGPGSKGVAVKDVAGSFPYLRLETSVAQTAVATLTAISKV